MKTEAVILAAGLGTRMKSDIPKVLHPLGGRPMITWTIEASREATGRDPSVVIGPGAEDVQRAAGEGIKFVEQKERLGTGHAVLQSADQLRDRCDQVLVVHADLPLLRAKSMQRLIEIQESNPGPLTLQVVQVKHALLR